ncbi:hypothetical protein TNCV_2340941 [Trichonephila clavipes]|nr:hypothetical protein TNCV_2340941 [Trichonephila clavipes]
MHFSFHPQIEIDNPASDVLGQDIDGSHRERDQGIKEDVAKQIFFVIARKSVTRRNRYAKALLYKIVCDCLVHNYGLFFINSRKCRGMSSNSSLFTVRPSKIDSRDTMSGISKNTSSMTIYLDRSWRNFCLSGDCGYFHDAD